MKYFRYKSNKICKVPVCCKILMKEMFKNLTKRRATPSLWMWGLPVSLGNRSQDHPQTPNSEEARCWWRTMHTVASTSHRFPTTDWKYRFQTSVGWTCGCKYHRYEGPNVVKILILPKFIYLFNSIPIKILLRFWKDYHLILKHTIKLQYWQKDAQIHGMEARRRST